MASRSTLQIAEETLGRDAEKLKAAGIERVIAFGSVARGEDRPDSDIDLLVVPAAGIRVGGLKVAAWRVMLTSLLDRTADAFVLDLLKDEVARQAEAEGIEIFNAH